MAGRAPRSTALLEHDRRPPSAHGRGAPRCGRSLERARTLRVQPSGVRRAVRPAPGASAIATAARQVSPSNSGADGRSVTLQPPQLGYHPRRPRLSGACDRHRPPRLVARAEPRQPTTRFRSSLADDRCAGAGTVSKRNEFLRTARHLQVFLMTESGSSSRWTTSRHEGPLRRRHALLRVIHLAFRCGQLPRCLDVPRSASCRRGRRRRRRSSRRRRSRAARGQAATRTTSCLRAATC